MTRFNITLQEGVDMVLWTLANGGQGDILVPKIPSYRILDLARAIGPECRTKVIGLRPGEKIHEEMITTSDSGSTIDLGDYYAILPAGAAVTDALLAERSASRCPRALPTTAAPTTVS